MNQTTTAKPQVVTKVKNIFELIVSLQELSETTNKQAYKIKERLLCTPVEETDASGDKTPVLGILDRIVDELNTLRSRTHQTNAFLAETIEQLEE